MASLRIPPDFPLGALFGKGGSRIKDVSRRCGARINVDQDRLLITFSGYGAAAAAAEYAEQFQEHREAVVSAYPHPAEAAVLLDAALAAGSAFVAARHGARAQGIWERGGAVALHPSPAECLAPTPPQTRWRPPRSAARRCTCCVPCRLTARTARARMS